MARRIDSLVSGEEVVLRFHGSRALGNAGYDDKVIFERIEGEGEDRRAIFDSFEAYRFNKRWVYGMSAERLSIVS